MKYFYSVVNDTKEIEKYFDLLNWLGFTDKKHVEFLKRLLNGSHWSKGFPEASGMYYCDKTSIEDILILKLALHTFSSLVRLPSNPINVLFNDPGQYVEGYMPTKSNRFEWNGTCN